jgi:transcriptional regulator with XRE-family HTH domain
MIKIKVWEVRDKKHMSLRKFAALSGISKTEINNIENKVKKPTVETMCAIARALQVPVTDLFEDTKGLKA